jgi:hypothetical protein
VPISYMLYVDAFGFTRGGIAGSMAFDAISGILASLLLGAMLLWLAHKSRSPLQKSPAWTKRPRQAKPKPRAPSSRTAPRRD